MKLLPLLLSSVMALAACGDSNDVTVSGRWNTDGTDRLCEVGGFPQDVVQVTVFESDGTMVNQEQFRCPDQKFELLVPMGQGDLTVQIDVLRDGPSDRGTIAVHGPIDHDVDLGTIGRQPPFSGL